MKHEQLFAIERIKAYKSDHQSLKTSKQSQIWTVDFTQHQTSMASKFHDFIVVVCTSDLLSIPESLLELSCSPEVPLSDRPQLVIEQVESHRRTKKEIVESGVPGRIQSKSNLRDDKAKLIKARKMPDITVVDTAFHPWSTYFHFVVGRSSKAQVSQTFDYVSWALNCLLDSGIMAGFSDLIIWSDGCGKHFKTYATHYEMARLQSTFQFNLKWRFLAPNKAHNRADAAAAHLKRSINTKISNYYLLSSVSHLAFANSVLKNSLLIEADFVNFPEKIDCQPEKERFIRDGFDFNYSNFSNVFLLANY